MIKLLSILCIFMSLSISTQAIPNNDPLEIQSKLPNSDILLIGWAHFNENNVIPDLITNHLSLFKKLGAAFLIEVDEQMNPISENSRIWYHSHSQSKLLSSALNLGIQVFAADIETPKNIKLKEEMQIRDKKMSDNIIKAFANGAGKVVLLVGGAHLQGIIENLAESNYSVGAIRTDADYFSGEVFLNSVDGNLIRKIGQFEPAEYLKTLNPGKYNVSFEKKPSVRKKYLSKLLNMCSQFY